MADLKTNYVDDVLDSSKNQLRKYQQIQNDDGTVSFVDVTEYSTTGTSFGAKDINDTNAAVNELNESLGENVNSLNLKIDSANSNISKKQDASTAITTSNIGSQSVNYANSSNYANSAGSANAATKAYKDGNGADIASTYLKGTQKNGYFKNRPSVNIDGTICGLIPTYEQDSHGYPGVGLYIQPGSERLIIDWYADGNPSASYIATTRV